jgi:antitoxin YefM
LANQQIYPGVHPSRLQVFVGPEVREFSCESSPSKSIFITPTSLPRVLELAGPPPVVPDDGFVSFLQGFASQRRERDGDLGVNMCDMSTHSLRDLRSNLGSVVRTVAASGEEAIITDSGTEVAVIISMADYERLHEHADVADALRLRELRARSFTVISLAEMLDALDVDAGAFAAR